MNYFNKKNLVIISIAVLLIVNIAAIGTVLFLTYKRPSMPEPPSRKSIRTVRENLKLSEDQKNTFEIFQKNYHEKTKQVFIEMHQKRVLMMDEFSKDQPDSVVLYDLAKETGVLHEQLKRLTINHLLDLKGVCNDEQFKYLEGMFRQKIMDDEPGMHQPFNRERKYRNRRTAKPQGER